MWWESNNQSRGEKVWKGSQIFGGFVYILKGWKSNFRVKPRWRSNCLITTLSVWLTSVTIDSCHNLKIISWWIEAVSWYTCVLIFWILLKSTVICHSTIFFLCTAAFKTRKRQHVYISQYNEIQNLRRYTVSYHENDIISIYCSALIYNK